MAIPQDRYYDFAPTAVWLKRLLYLSLAMTAVSAVSTLMELRLLDAAERGAFPSDEALTEAAETSDRWSGIIGIISLIVFIATSVQALTWIYRSAHNARVRATYMEYTPASCVWWYFVPIATLWKPFGAMREIWRQFATQAGRPEDTGRLVDVLDHLRPAQPGQPAIGVSRRRSREPACRGQVRAVRGALRCHQHAHFHGRRHGTHGAATRGRRESWRTGARAANGSVWLGHVQANRYVT